jgi:peptide subunit release factor 1 (eRF1)
MSLNQQIDKVAAFEPNGFPFVSLYLNTQPDQHGRDDFERAEHLVEPRSAAAVADMLVARALLTGAEVTFIEDTKLLGDVRGVGAFLRYRN